MKELVLKKGTIIFKTGAKGDAMYAITKGEVGIYINYGEKAQKCLVTLTEGKFFGEMAVIEKAVRSATAVVEKDAVLVEYKADSLAAFVKDNAEMSAKLLSNLSARLRGLTEDYMEAVKTIAEMAEIPVCKKELDRMEKEDKQAAKVIEKAEKQAQKPEKKSIWQKIKHFASVYADSLESYSNFSTVYPNTYNGINGPFFF